MAMNCTSAECQGITNTNSNNNNKLHVAGPIGYEPRRVRALRYSNTVLKATGNFEISIFFKISNFLPVFMA